MLRFPTRTLVLMVLTLVAFGWMRWRALELRARATPARPLRFELLGAFDAGLHPAGEEAPR